MDQEAPVGPWDQASPLDPLIPVHPETLEDPDLPANGNIIELIPNVCVKPVKEANSGRRGVSPLVLVVRSLQTPPVRRNIMELNLLVHTKGSAASADSSTMKPGLY